ncbi:hypothetical protein P4S72_28010 [Vibrio sp. PP-XX7]
MNHHLVPAPARISPGKQSLNWLLERKVKSALLGLIVHTLKEVNEQLQKGRIFSKTSVSRVSLATEVEKLQALVEKACLARLYRSQPRREIVRNLMETIIFF